MSIYGISLFGNEHVLVRRRHLEWRIKSLCSLNVSLFDPQTLDLATRMAVTLSGLPCISPFDCIGEPATLAQRWDKWQAEFELYVAALGVDNKVQKRALLLHLAGPGVREIFKTYPVEVQGDAKEFDKAMTCLWNTSKSRRMYLQRGKNCLQANRAG